MGLLVAELPNKAIHTWSGRDPTTIARFLAGFRRRIEDHVAHDPEVQRQAAGHSLAELVESWVFGMLQHVLTTPTPPGTEDFRKMFLTYRLLTLKPIPESGHLDKSFAELLPDYDLEFRLMLADGNLVFDYRLWPLGTASEIRLSDWTNGHA